MDDAAREPVSGLAALVVKAGVGIGSLSDSQRALALGLVWAGLPRTQMNERGINEALKALLAGAARCLDTDHVELRRWLCDAGWVERDGYGRAYLRVSREALPTAQASLGAALDAAFGAPSAVTTWVEALRRQRDAARLARRKAFAARGVAAGQPASDATPAKARRHG